MNYSDGYIFLDSFLPVLITFICSTFVSWRGRGLYDLKRLSFPPGYVFGIVWIILYSLLVVVGYKYLSYSKNNNTNYTYFQCLFYLNLLLNFGWCYLYFWICDTVFSFIIMFPLILTTIYLIFLTGNNSIPTNVSSICVTFLSIYLGWLFCAVVLNYYSMIMNVKESNKDFLIREIQTKNMKTNLILI